MSTFFCIYCGNERSDTSREHIIPEALGGTLIIREAVCSRCNSELGRKIDAEFVDSEYMRFVRYRYMDFLPDDAIPDFTLDAVLVSGDQQESFPGYLRFSTRGIEFQTKFRKEVTGNEIRYYFPDSKEGRKAFEGLKASKTTHTQTAEWTLLPTLPTKIGQIREVHLPFALELFKMYLGYLAYKCSAQYATDQRFDPVREFIQGTRADLGGEPYHIRTGHRNNPSKSLESVSHEIGFRVSNGLSLFYVILFGSLLFEIDIAENLSIAPIGYDRIPLRRRRGTNNIGLLHILDGRYE